MTTNFPSLYTPDSLFCLKRDISILTDFFWNEGNELRKWDDYSWELLYEYYMQEVLPWVELPKDCLDEDGCNIPEAETEAEQIMFTFLPEMAKDKSMKTGWKEILRGFKKKMESYCYKTDEERRAWKKFFRKMIKKS